MVKISCICRPLLCDGECDCELDECRDMERSVADAAATGYSPPTPNANTNIPTTNVYHIATTTKEEEEEDDDGYNKVCSRFGIAMNVIRAHPVNMNDAVAIDP